MQVSIIAVIVIVFVLLIFIHFTNARYLGFIQYLETCRQEMQIAMEDLLQEADKTSMTQLRQMEHEISEMKKILNDLREKIDLREK